MLVEADCTSSEQGNRKNRRRNKKSNTGMMQTVVQQLFETCQEVFSGPGTGTVPSPEDVLRLKSVLDTVTASDVGLTPNMRYFRHNDYQKPPITYLHLYECDNFSIGIFCLPPSGVIPLHNHPGMTVFSKLLFGSMHVKSYDWVDTPHGRQVGPTLAMVKSDKVITAPCDTTVLYPNDGGNMHCFTAHTQCAVLDVLGPPYSDEEGRHCTYYNDFSLSSFPEAMIQGNNNGYAWLEERAKPDDFMVVGAPYRGPRIVGN
ncbi:plant cysteine oxidase 1-like [Carex rostrata]